MTKILYIADDCHDCDMVMDALKEKGVELPNINFDKDQPNLSIDLYIFPVLLNEKEEILAYGGDILDQF